MRHVCTTMIARGTPKDLIRAASLGARVATRWRRAEGQDDDEIRREVLAHFRSDMLSESYGEYADEMIMAVVQRSLEDVLREAPARHRSR
ncbi:MAG: hypothetical protein JO284_06885 [Planctomycetaceae bacterium]|nr:hypothetical protein [Planctomycetaceae bacterium]MBV8232544.1 hypothetical protein [Planctomycetaceae bacterium]MBV8270082.1 hypothetical protein [Planctomycetaceae bacterium]MBV8315038.1 hypothetical protein [Planctomycetaceae bacterium]MBV8557826.1 hypothetical protein [Planctomycetaceae bacterium]